jgi:hypothetical protein
MIKNSKGFGAFAFIIVIAVIAAIGGGAYIKSKKNPAEVKTDMQATTTTSSTSGDIVLGSSVQGSIRSLLTSGKDLNCTVTFATTTSKGELKTNGNIFIAGNEMRGDFTMEGASVTVKDAHMIRQSDTVYAWSGKQGAKMAFSNLSGAGVNANSQVDIDQNISYNCSDWQKDATKFVVPSDVKIFDVSAIKVNSVNGVNVQTR